MQTSARRAIVRRTPVQPVACDGRAKAGKMHAELMRSPRDGLGFHKGTAVFSRQHAKFGFGGLGVGRVGGADLSHDDACRRASYDEIICRYYKAQCDKLVGRVDENTVYKIENIMRSVSITTSDRAVVRYALEKQEATGQPAAALQLPDGRIVLGKTTSLLGASAALILNALKALGGIDRSIKLISPSIIEPVQTLKVDHLGNHNPRLHVDEVLIALAISAVTSETAAIALDQIGKLAGCEAHSSVILAQTDSKTFKKLGINITCEPRYQVKKLYHAK